MVVEAFAVYSDDDQSLTFYKRENVPRPGQKFEGKTATAVYTGFLNGEVSNKPWSNRAGKVKTITVVDVGIAPTDVSKWFMSFTNCTSVDLGKLDMSKVVSAASMLENCYKLVSANLSSWNATSLENTARMFYGCRVLVSANLSGWNTGKLNAVYGMFNGCNALATLNLADWGMKAPIKQCYNMLLYCNALRSIDLSGFDMTNVSDMDRMFEGCTALEKVRLGNKFRWVGNSGYLPANGPDRKWYAWSDYKGYIPSAIPSMKADTYYANKSLIKLPQGYVGVPTEIYGHEDHEVQTLITSGNITDFFTVKHGQYYFIGDLAGLFRSNNRGLNGTTASILLTAKKVIKGLSFQYKVSSGSGDLYSITVNNDMVVNNISGNGTWLSYTTPAEVSKVVLTYRKNQKGGSYDDTAYIKDIMVTTNETVLKPTGIKPVARKLKAMYIGVPTKVPVYENREVTKEVQTLITSDNIDRFFTVKNDQYYFVGNSSGVFKSNSQGTYNTRAVSTWTAKKPIKRLSFDYRVSSEAKYDTFTITVSTSYACDGISGNGKLIHYEKNSGLPIGPNYNSDIVMEYKKDYSGNGYEDTAYIQNIQVVTDETVIENVQVGVETKSIARKVATAFVGVSDGASRSVAREVYKTLNTAQ